MPLTESGLSQGEAAERLRRHGPNALPETRPPSLALVFLRQFLSPLIYILLAAAVVSAALSDLTDAIFIGAVLLINGIIGTVQEYSASLAAAVLRKLEQARATVMRDGVRREIDGRELVPGDLVLLDTGGKVPADLRLVASEDLRCDESLLTGESVPVRKAVGTAGGSREVEPRAALAYAGTMVVRGRGRGIVVATGPRPRSAGSPG